MGKSTISMAMFNSYVSLPEGNVCKAIVNHSKNYHQWVVIINHGLFIALLTSDMGIDPSSRWIFTNIWEYK